jgi:hypothetical protein
MHYWTGGGFESTGYFRLSALKEKIISEIDKGHPVIISLDYPGVGAHAIMAVGYTKTSNSYNLIYHNPQGTGEETMYTERNIDQLFVKKSMSVAVQILYPKEVPHPDRSLFTVGMPLGAVGHIRIEVPAKSIYNIIINEKISNADGYSWFWNQTEFNSIPDTAKSLNISLPLWNATKGDALAAKMNIFITKNDVSIPVFDSMEDITIKSGSEATWYNLSIPLSQFVKENGSKEYRISVRLYDNSFNYLDGYDIKAKIEPQKKVVENYQTADLGTPEVLCSTSTSGNFNFNTTSFDFSKTSGTKTYKIHAEWNAVPSGLFKVINKQVFWDLTMKIKLESNSALVNGATIRLEPLDPNYGFYQSWNHPNEVSFGLYSEAQIAYVPGSSSSKNAEATVNMPIILYEGLGSTMPNYDGQVILRGSVSGVLPSSEVFYFGITINYPRN